MEAYILLLSLLIMKIDAPIFIGIYKKTLI